MNYCEKCMIITKDDFCPICGTKKIREPQDFDSVYLITKDIVWAGSVEDILNKNKIPFLKKAMLGAGLATKIGFGMEQYHFYVPYSAHVEALKLMQEIFYVESEND